MSGHLAPRSRCLLVWLTATAALVVCWILLRPTIVRGWATARAPGSLGHAALDQVLVEMAAVVLLACAAWLWLATTAVVAEAGPGMRLPLGAPTWVRRPVLAACGFALVSGLGQPALAVSTQIHLADPTTDQSSLQVLDGLPLPDRALGGPAPTSGGRRATSAPRVVVVTSGDSLWDIASRLSPDASAAQVARRWREIYAANRAVIGDDPDLIRPGQQLVIHERSAS